MYGIVDRADKETKIAQAIDTLKTVSFEHCSFRYNFLEILCADVSTTGSFARHWTLSKITKSIISYFEIYLSDV